MLLRYPGGKSKGAAREAVLSKLYSSLATHDYEEYREPFFGSGAIGFNLMKQGIVERAWLNDLDPGIGTLWDATINQSTRLEGLIRSFVPSTDAFFQFKRDLLDPCYRDDSVTYGFKKLALNRISFSGLGTMSGGPLGGHAGRGIGTRWSRDKLVADLRTIKGLIRNVRLHGGTCTREDFEALVNAPGRSLLYLDPPYYGKGSRLYQYGFADDHERLAACLRDCEHDWVLSYDDCPQIRELYHWAHIETVTVGYCVSGSSKKTELVITPGP